jgi:hypothetical protein
MKKHPFILTLAALACGAAFAQAPAGVVAKPSAESSPNAAPGTPAAKAEMKVDTKKANGSTLSAPNPVAGMGGAAPSEKINPSASGGSPAAKAEMKVDTRKSGQMTMDANGDGMISKREWDRYHSGMWGKMKTKNGMMSMADMEAQMKSGPN